MTDSHPFGLINDSNSGVLPRVHLQKPKSVALRRAGLCLGATVVICVQGKAGERCKESQSSIGKKASVLTTAASEGTLESLWRQGGAPKGVWAGDGSAHFSTPHRKGKAETNDDGT